MATKEAHIAMSPNKYVNAGFQHSSFEVNTLCRRLLVPNDPKEISWVEENQRHFRLDGARGKQQPWHLNGPINTLDERRYKGNECLHTVYKTSKEIVKDCGNNVDASRSLNELLSHIVWQRKASKPSGTVLYTHTMQIRRVMKWLISSGNVPSVPVWQKDNTWLSDAIVKLVNSYDEKAKLAHSENGSEKDRLVKDFKTLEKILLGEIGYGEKQIESRVDNEASAAIDRINSTSKNAYVNDHFVDAAKEKVISRKVRLASPSEDDDEHHGLQKAIEIKLAPSALSDHDAKYVSRHVADAMQMSRVQGPFLKETDTADLAAFKLSASDPASLEALTMILMAILGRPKLNPSEMTVRGKDVLSMPSIHDPNLEVEVRMPLGWDITHILERHEEIKKRIQNKLKKNGGLNDWALKISGVARFGAFKFHGKLGAVIAAQLQGNATAPNVTAGYCQLTTEDYQKGFNTVFLDLMRWIIEEDNYFGPEWKSWAEDQIKATLPAAYEIRHYGSERLTNVTNDVKKSIEKELSRKFRSATHQSTPLAISDYLTSCALSLHMALQLAIGSRPPSTTMKLVVSGNHIVIADKAWGKLVNSRMISLPTSLISALMHHQKNILQFSREYANEPADCSLHHPFFAAIFDRKSGGSIAPITSSQISQWMSQHIGKPNVHANALRHNKITDLQRCEYSDGTLTHLVGHERRGNSITSKFQSAPAALKLDLSDIWVPTIKDICDV